MGSLLLFSVLLLFPLTASWAAPACSLSTLAESIVETELVLLPEEKQAVESTLCAASTLSGPASRIRLTFHPEMMRFKYPEGLFLAPHFQPAGARGSGFQHTLGNSAPVWAHEFGHAVLGEKILAKNKIWAGILLRLGDFESLNDQLENCARAKPLCPGFKTLLRKRQEFWREGEWNEASKFAKVFFPYDELFADTLSVLVFGDPKAMSRAFHYPAMDPSDAYNASLRDFSLEHKASDALPLNPHGMLAPARHWIWQNWILSPSGNNLMMKSLVLEKLSRAIESEMSRRLQGGEADSSPQRVNLELIEVLKAQNLRFVPTREVCPPWKEKACLLWSAP